MSGQENTPNPTITCDLCGVTSRLTQAFTGLDATNTHACPTCQHKRISEQGRKKWLFALIGLVVTHLVLFLLPNLSALYLVIIGLWMVVLTFIGIVVHELGHYLAARFLGGICPIVSFGEGTILWTHKSQNTVWQFCSSPTLGLAYCAFPNDKSDLWRYLIMLSAGGLMNIALSGLAFSVFFMVHIEEQTNPFDVMLVICGLSNGYLALTTFFSPSEDKNLLNDGTRIFEAIKDPSVFYSSANWAYQMNFAHALTLREKFEDLVDYIKKCQAFESSIDHCSYLANGYSRTFQYKLALKWSEHAMLLVNQKESGNQLSGQGLMEIKARLNRDLAFSLLCNQSQDRTRVLDLSRYAKQILPWEPSVIRTEAAAQVRFADAERGVEILSSELGKDEEQNAYGIAIICLFLAEGYQKLGRTSDAELALARAQESDPEAAEAFSLPVQ